MTCAQAQATPASALLFIHAGSHECNKHKHTKGVKFLLCACAYASACPYRTE